MSYFNGEKSLNLRIWHWFSGIAILGLMFTDIFRDTWFNKSENALKIQNRLLEFGIQITNEQAINIAKLIRESMWEWHCIFGFFLVFLLFFRLFAFLVQGEKCPIKKLKETTLFSNKVIKTMHLVFYFITFFVCISGVIMYFKNDLGIAKESLRLVKELHVYSFWFFLLFILLHVLGVIKEDIQTSKGLISEMFNGGKS